MTTKIEELTPMFNGAGASASARQLPTAGDAIRALVHAGPIQRLETGLATLDEITRGGLMFGRCHAIGGVPNVGKTALAVQLAHRAARAGIATAIHCADVDDREAVATRIGQAEEMSLDDLENRRPDALKYLAGLLDEMPHLVIRDQDEDEVFLEDTIVELVALAAGRPAVLVLDSLQTVRTRLGAAAEVENDMERVKAAVKVCKHAAKAHKFCVVFPCELSRGAYGSKNKAEQSTDISSFKHSGDIEHAITVGLVIRFAEDEGDVDVSVPKNKRGRGSRPFRLRLDRRTCRFAEVPMPAEGTTAAGEVTHDKAVEAAKERIRRALGRNTDLTSRNKLSKKAGGNKQTNFNAIGEMVDDHEIVTVMGCLRLDPLAASRIGSGTGSGTGSEKPSESVESGRPESVAGTGSGTGSGTGRDRAVLGSRTLGAELGTGLVEPTQTPEEPNQNVAVDRGALPVPAEGPRRRPGTALQSTARSTTRAVSEPAATAPLDAPPFAAGDVVTAPPGDSPAWRGVAGRVVVESVTANVVVVGFGDPPLRRKFPVSGATAPVRVERATSRATP